MKNQVLLTITFVFLSSIIYGQRQFSYGIKAGLNIANVDEVGSYSNGFTEEGYLGGLPMATGVRPQVGAWLSLPITEKLVLQPELLWTQKYLKYQSTNEDLDHTNFDYLSLPLLVGYRFHEHWSVELGPEVSYMLSATLKDPGGTGAMLSTAIKEDNLEFGANVGLKYQKEDWVLGIRYHRSFTSFQNFTVFELSGVPIGEIKQYHQGLVFWVGYTIKA